MKIILFAFGLWFVYWNCCGLSENLSAVWHFIALLVIAVSLALWVLHGVINWLVASDFDSDAQSSFALVKIK